MDKKKRGGGSSEQQPSPPIPRLAVDTSHSSQQPPPLPSSPSPLPPLSSPPPPSQALIKLERYVHVANAWCDNTSACFPRSALQAQAQAQPRAASFGVSCAIQGRHPEADARITVLALSTRQPSLLLRMSGNAWASLEGEGAVVEGDYMYEWPILPTGGGSGSSSGGGGRSHSGRGSGRRLAGSGPPNAMACLALSDDLRRFLCVTREGNAYGLHVRRVVKAARRVYDHEHEQDGITTGNDLSSKMGKENQQRGPTNNKNSAQQQRKASGSSSDDHQQQRFNPLGPSLFDFSLDPKYQRDGPGSLQMLPGGGGGAGSGGGGGGGGGGSGGGGGAQRRAKDISLGSMSAEGEFVPRCCVWWTPAKGAGRGGGGGLGSPVACSSMAIVGGTSGGRGALSILDMDQEREVDLLYVPSSSVEGGEAEIDGGRGVAALQIHTVGGSSSSSSSRSSSDSPLQQRILLITLASGRLYSLVLESSTDPMAPPSPSKHQQQQQQQQQDDLSPSRSSSSSSRRHSGSSSSSSSTPQNQKMKYPRAATLGLPPSSPMTPPRSSPHSTTTTEASSSSSSSRSTQSIGSLLLNSPQRGRKKGKKKGSSGGGGGREGGGGGGGGSSWGLNESNSSRVDEGQEEREAESLWDRCFARLDPYSSSLGLPRQPHIHTCFASTDGMFESACPLWRRDDGGAGGGGGGGAAAAAARLPPGWWEDTRVVTAVQSISKEKEDGREEGHEEAFGLVLSRLSPNGRGLAVEVHYCALAASGGVGVVGGAATAAAAGGPACRCLCQMALAEDLEALPKSAGRSSSSKGGEMCVSRVIEATLMPEKFLVLSVSACRRPQGGGPAAAAWGEDIGENEEGVSSSSYWLLTYRLPQDEAEDKDGYVGPPISSLLRAFQSPTKAPVSFLGWLVPVKPDIRDILTLARSRMFLPPTSSTAAAVLTGPDDVLAWSLAVWSRCSVFLLRLLANKEEETMSSSPRPGRRGGFALPEFPLPSSLPSSLQARALAPGEMVAFVKDLGREGKVNEALTLAWSLLLYDLDDGSSNPAPKGPALHPEYFKRLRAADSWLRPGGPGRARVALQCVRWMVMVGGRAPAGWTKEELLLFLEACPDYNLGKVVALLLARRRVSEALFASWVREKVPGLSKTLDCLAAMASSSSPSTASSSLSLSSSSSSAASLLMPLSRSDVAWLCGVGAGKCIIQAGRSVLWAVLPLRLQLDILLSDPHLLLLHEQYQWLLATLPTLPRPCIGALVLQLSYWLGLGPLPTREPPPPLPMSPRLVVAVAASQEKEEGGARGVPLIAAWSSREGVVAGLAVAVDGLAARTDTAAATTEGEEGEEDWEENEDEESYEDHAEAQENERKRRETRMLSDLLLEALLILAQPLAYTCMALQAHRLAQQKTFTSRSNSTFLARPVDLSLPEREALEAQLLLEQLLVALATQSAASVTSFSSTSLSRNVHFTPAIILMRALTRTTTTPKNAGAAALLLEAAGEWEGALQVRLEEVAKITTGRAEGVEVDQAKEEATEVLLGLLQSHVLLREDTLQWSTRKRMAAKFLESWARLGLPPHRLESVILPSGDDKARTAAGVSPWSWHMGVALLTDLLILHAGASDSLVDADGAVVAPESEPLRFSSSFYVRLTEHIKAHGQAMQQAGMTDLWSTGGRAPALLRVPRPTAALWDALYKQIQGLEAGQAAANRIEVPLQRLLDAMARDRSISSSNGGGEKRGVAAASRAGGRRLLAPGGFADRWAGEEQEERVPIVAFSCGHVLSQVELLERFVPALESKLTGLARPLHLTTEILCQEYRALTGAGGGLGGWRGMGGGSHQGISLACPSCVTAFLVNMVNQQEQQTQ